MAGSRNINAGILKIAGMFGSLQMINVVCSVLRAKLVAIWIGPVGVGLFGIFNSAVDLISSIAQLGLRPSGVKEIAKASPGELPAIAKTVRRLGWVLGLAGMLLTMALSPLLSLITFGNTHWWWSFALLSATVALNASNNAEGAIFQGLNRFKRLAACTVAGVAGGTVVSVPLFYFLRTQSIVPSIIAYSLCIWVALGFYRQPIPKGAAAVSRSERVAISRRLLTFGIYFTLSTAFNSLIIYVFMSWLNTVASTDTVGLFQAGSTIVTRYAGMVFTALAMEYLPRLSRFEGSKSRTALFVSNQLFLSVPCTSALVCGLIALSGVAVRVLYDSSFLAMLPYLIVALGGTLFRAYSWCVATVILARGDGRTFIVTETLSGLLFMLLHISGYLLGGFLGLGIAYALWYGAYSAIALYVFRRRYGLKLRGPVGGMMWVCTLSAAACALIALLASPLWALTVALPHALWCARLVMRRIR